MSKKAKKRLSLQDRIERAEYLAFNRGFEAGANAAKTATEAKYDKARLTQDRLKLANDVCRAFGQALDAMAHALRAAHAPEAF